ncbi:DUF3141 domain-containing protein [Tabrizicola sp. J26]|uniref:DUF3141 domain-containing protein n=1 Tax=Alitabrizicola rongguiensis TaxID=2909234 RepID=UPI001F3AA8FF|nr:DUF3141 domain-containing protein [Tabrizicola rongguiensis]MCF1708418.1 DUF3141 domain-containing protein [Tabrizicola rongguiensis]
MSIPTAKDMADYAVDAAQRNILFLDVLRQRADQYLAHAAEKLPTVLDYDHDLVLDGRDLKRPCNYFLLRIRPPEGVAVDPLKCPFVIVDPRAGHGPGIGGFKADSEIGVALKAGHPCYFIGFRPKPEPGQTILDILDAWAAFLETVIASHPRAEGKPCVIGNCQAGWSVMMLASLRPELFGPVILAGTPLSYWGGVRGRYPMRYSGGLLGGSWLTALTGDLGGGIFDGAWLVQNFENQNPANTLWSKQYNLWANVDTEADRYLGFEKWWGGHVTLNAEEMQFIVDELFVGNHLAAGEIRGRDGTEIDLRNIASPIVCFCSRGDNITPPQQALDWILDLYDSVDDIRANGQTIVYAIHDTIGHLGIFVSAGVARKEHDEFASNIDLIDVLPPGLYEAVFTPRAEAGEDEFIHGDWVMRVEARTLDDIRALGGNTLEDEKRFEAAAKVSEMNLALYRTFAQPWVKAISNPQMAEAMRKLHPLRLGYELFASQNPFMAWVQPAAEKLRENRHEAEEGNPLLDWQKAASEKIVEGLEAWREAVEKLSEDTFLAVYGNEMLQKAVGVDPESPVEPRHAPKRLLHRQLVERRIGELRAAFGKGGLREATLRALIYAGRSRGGVDERGFEAIRRFRRTETGKSTLSLAEFKQLVREQYLMLLIDEDAAMAALPDLLAVDEPARAMAVSAIRTVLGASGPIEPEVEARLQTVERMFHLPEAPVSLQSAPKRRSGRAPS